MLHAPRRAPIFALALILVAAASSPVYAQPLDRDEPAPLQEPLALPQPRALRLPTRPALTDTPTTRGPDPTSALTASLVPTLIGLLGGTVGSFVAGAAGNGGAMLASSIIGATVFSVGPSMGIYYAGGHGGRATGTLVGRLLLTGGAGVAGTFGLFSLAFGSESLGAAMLTIGSTALIAAIGLAIWDIVDAPRFARERRDALRRAATRPQVSLAPIVSADRQTGARTYGAAAAVTF